MIRKTPQPEMAIALVLPHALQQAHLNTQGLFDQEMYANMVSPVSKIQECLRVGRRCLD